MAHEKHGVISHRLVGKDGLDKVELMRTCALQQHMTRLYSSSCCSEPVRGVTVSWFTVRSTS